jgi:hypothetical protein
MSRNNSTGRRRRTAFGLATAAGGALATAVLSMGTAHATPYIDPYLPPDPYDVLFGARGWQGLENAKLDANLLLTNPTGDVTFEHDVVAFEAGDDHAIADLINALDPSAFYEQIGGGAIGTLTDGAYLVPDDGLGYLATSLDAGLLTPLGLDYILDPLIQLLLGQP